MSQENCAQYELGGSLWYYGIRWIMPPKHIFSDGHYKTNCTRQKTTVVEIGKTREKSEKQYKRNDRLKRILLCLPNMTN